MIKKLVFTTLLLTISCIMIGQKPFNITLDKRVDSSVLSKIHSLEVLFPELAGVKIHVKSARIKTTLNCKPTVISSIFSGRKNRVYIIKINHDKTSNGISYPDIPKNALSGLWSHELAHISDYKKVGVVGLIRRALWYTGKKKKATFEKSIDLSVICHGNGINLYTWNDWVINQSNALSWYKDYKRQYYMLPQEIIQEMYGKRR